MRNTVLETLRTYGMLQKGDCVTVGLSGGADSVCLLHILCTLREELSVTLQAVHVHHGIRGAAADRDEQFCRTYCARLQVPITVVHADVPKLSRESHESEEACGRRIRYAAFQRAAGNNGKIATAHTADDNAETVLLNLTRGTGLRGLCGIPPVRGNIIRPLISVPRAQVEQYCTENSLEYVTDETNFSADYSRNRIRLEVLPVLKSLNPSLLSGVSGMTARLRTENAVLEQQANVLVKDFKNQNRVPTVPLKNAPKALACRALQAVLAEKIGEMPTAAHLESVYALLFKNGSVSLPSGVIVRVRNGYLEFPNPEETPEWAYTLHSDCMTAEKDTPAGVVKIQKYTRKDLQNLHKDLLANAVDCAKIVGTLTLRSRRAGDRFTFPKRAVSKSLKKWMNEEKIPPESRNKVPLLTDESGAVLWLGGVGASANALPTAETEVFFVLTFSCGGNTNV